MLQLGRLCDDPRDQRAIFGFVDEYPIANFDGVGLIKVNFLRHFSYAPIRRYVRRFALMPLSIGCTLRRQTRV